MTCHDTYEDRQTTLGRVVVGVDGSPTAVAALRWADHQARMSGSLLEVVHVFTSATQYAFSPGGLPEMLPIEPARLQRSAEGLLRRALLDADVDAAHVRLTVLDDTSPTRALGRAAGGASLLVVGAHRHHGLGELLGSTATACVKHATCPVVVVPAAAASLGAG